ncbi:glucose-6-phosphate dehydrogenase [Basidiobolus meristosporus CBS 931.73]|uniref:Glucose-6-phosphate 1-dehydrogenase n=1 Tax=Basidiobolus meristosporus CBS 931.73 TaxID=1314790 RepID=A0A1Y1XW24_9FUNG|nr:glucose-6-phosphate dehydrogenase [Basidiobolus meristosporus CBS 931.73]ORX89947.1 glucose-6-phosphate dehydrogenase [Basidiobolus meristosporus CBS 931.73]|eukprot:ORX64362.1 glucose-6-phosphate dehydrogenase [Basidiobolus meristosporus CBS 931.73]
MTNLTQESTVIVVFGASGDLAKKKTYPALFGLYRNRFLSRDTHIVGYARSHLELDEFKKRIASYLKFIPSERNLVDGFLEHLHYISGQYDEDASFQKLNQYLEELAGERKNTNRVFYMALPPSVFIPVAQQVKKNVYTTQGSNRLIVEKPFGKDFDSSKVLLNALGACFKEEEIYRIDHYLGKEMVKNIMSLRFANVFLGAIWNRQYIDNVQITFKEPFGTEGRGGYFDEFGIIRDVMQNHLLQILSLVAMESPASLDAEDIRTAKVDVLKYIEPITKDNILIGQYVGSEDGSKPGYLDDETVPKGSNTPTYAVASMFVNNERWKGIPFILKCGKALNEQKAEIRIQFRDVENCIFPNHSRNELVIRVQPNEAVYMKITNKKPGLSMDTVISELDLSYRRRFSDVRIPEAYEALILDALQGDHSNFVRDDELDEAWRIFTPILHQIEREHIEPLKYTYGSRGPTEAQQFIESHGFERDRQEYIWVDDGHSRQK